VHSSGSRLTLINPLTFVLLAAGLTGGMVGCSPDPVPALVNGPEAPLAPEVPLTYRDIQKDTALYMAMLAAEDRRAPVDEDLEIFRRGFLSEYPGIRRAAVRGWGRLGRGSLMPELIPFLSDPTPEVRAEAADALAWAAEAGSQAQREQARTALAGRLSEETDPAVLAVLVRSISRIPFSGTPDEGSQIRETERLLLEVARSGTSGGISSPTVLLGVTRGAQSLYSLNDIPEPDIGLVRLLEEISLDSGMPAMLRRSATEARVAAMEPDAGHLIRLMDDPDPGVRMLAVRYAIRLPEDEDQKLLLRRSAADPAAEVRVEGVMGWSSDVRLSSALSANLTGGIPSSGSSGTGGESCERLTAAAADTVDIVAVTALNALGPVCRSEHAAAEMPGEMLTTTASALSDAGNAGWHRPTAALTSLAIIDPASAGELLPRYLSHPNSFVRVHAAEVATALRNEAALRVLAGDPIANVRTAAASGLVQVVGHAADPVLIGLLRSPEPQLLLVVSDLLEGTRQTTTALPALLDALDDISSRIASTTRATRTALLTRIEELGSYRTAGSRVEPYLSDIDPVIAERAAEVIQSWTGEERATSPEGLVSLPLPAITDLRTVENTHYQVFLSNGLSFVVRLLPFESPTNAVRFARMARDGVLDGLTIHEVAPNRYIKGGSPRANNYASSDLFTRDETGLIGHWRGTLGFSLSDGPDTGNGLFFINLADYPETNHSYTVFGEIIEGQEVPSTVLEGTVIDLIRRIDISR
jgi:cyclophilin family peptidyl-prolyl cis-trans isomerase/HEAT repeat protein